MKRRGEEALDMEWISATSRQEPKEESILSLFGKAQLEDLQERISRVTGLAIVTANYKGESIVEGTNFCEFCTIMRNNDLLRDNCKSSDAHGSIQAASSEKPFIYQCPCGIMDIAIPIIVNGTYLGGFLCGQALCSDPPDDLVTLLPATRQEDIDAVCKLNASLKNTLPEYPYERFVDIANLVSLIIQMLCENKIIAMQRQYELEHEIRMMGFLQSQLVSLYDIYENADYATMEMQLSRLSNEIMQFVSDDSDRIREACWYISRNVARFAAVKEKESDPETPDAAGPAGPSRYPEGAENVKDDKSMAFWLFGLLDHMITADVTEKYPILTPVLQFMDQHIQENLTLTDITRHCNISQGYLSRLFRVCFRISVTDYIHIRKIQRAKELMYSTNLNASDVAVKVGYQEYGYFSRVFKKYTGITIKDYKASVRNHRNL